MTTPEEVAAKSAAAAKRIRSHVEWTPLVKDQTLGAGVNLKCENLQTTGSFKARGALAKLTCLSSEELSGGVVTASTGNHGAAVSYAADVVGTKATVFVPDRASSVKLAAIERWGGEVRVFGSDGVESEIHAREVAAETGRVYVSPYNDIDVIAGQGTVGLEILRDLPDVDVVIVAVGGGGLISGVASSLRAKRPNLRVVACSPENSAAMAASLKAGRVVEIDSKDTISDGTHGGVEADSITFDLCRQLIDDFVTVSEKEIVAAMVAFMENQDMVIEGSAGVALATYRRLAGAISQEKVAIVLCGSNISDETLALLSSAG